MVEEQAKLGKESTELTQAALDLARARWLASFVSAGLVGVSAGGVIGAQVGDDALLGALVGGGVGLAASIGLTALVMRMVDL